MFGVKFSHSDQKISFTKAHTIIPKRATSYVRSSMVKDWIMSNKKEITKYAIGFVLWLCLIIYAFEAMYVVKLNSVIIALMFLAALMTFITKWLFNVICRSLDNAKQKAARKKALNRRKRK